ncbi:acyl carrier protein [Sphingomonas oligophenolica]|uniref:Acyl carrier protein n=1 Tax=Sphingomonas oligophenolica TaxID=301154 RepID=A0ABU9Y9L5_9SPHN
MTDSEILERLTDIFHDILDDDSIVLQPETTAADIKDWDSANHINIVVAVEGRFGIKIRNAEVERLKDVGDFVALIRSKLDR